jgi:hypothetical protein
MIEREADREEEYENYFRAWSILNGRTIYYQPFIGPHSEEKPPVRHDAVYSRR